jgi:hypothetical protein
VANAKAAIANVLFMIISFLDFCLPTVDRPFMPPCP